jgi:hypothetical protein
MATSWQTIFREVAKHLNAFASGSAATVSANYLTSPLTTTQVADPYFNLDFIKDKAIDAHGRLALEIADVRTHPWRAFIGNSITNALASGAVLPTLATNNKSIVGAYGQVNSGGVPCSKAAPERVRAVLINSIPPLYPLSVYLYYIDGNRVYHTESTVTIHVCTYERADVVTTVAANGDITLPDVLVDALVAGAVAALVIEAKGMEQGAYFKNYFERAIESIRQGQTTMPMMATA